MKIVLIKKINEVGDMSQPPGSPGHPKAPVPRTPREVPSVRSDALLQGGRELVIQHGAEQYRLRQTSSGKLILTK